jgi:hypothetical protein
MRIVHSSVVARRIECIANVQVDGLGMSARLCEGHHHQSYVCYYYFCNSTYTTSTAITMRHGIMVDLPPSQGAVANTWPQPQQRSPWMPLPLSAPQVQAATAATSPEELNPAQHQACQAGQTTAAAGAGGAISRHVRKKRVAQCWSRGPEHNQNHSTSG